MFIFWSVLLADPAKQGAALQHLCDSFIKSLTHWSFVKKSLCRRHALMAEDEAFCQK